MTYSLNIQNHLEITNFIMTTSYQTYKLGDFKLKSGGVIPDAQIAYKTIGDPSLPAIINPTWWSGCKDTFSAKASVY